MKLNKFLWTNYKETENGKRAIELFTEGETTEVLNNFLGTYHEDILETASFIDELNAFAVEPIIPNALDLNGAEMLFNDIVEKGFALKYPDDEIIDVYKSEEFDFL